MKQIFGLWLIAVLIGLAACTPKTPVVTETHGLSADTAVTNITTQPIVPYISPDTNNGTISQTMVSWAEHYGAIGDLVKAADLIVTGKVVGIARSYVDKGIPFTDFNIEVEPALKGTANSTVLVRQTGGTATNPASEISDDPLLVTGKTYFLFLREGSLGRYVILGGPQGRFEVFDSRVYSLSVLYPDKIISDLGVAGTPLPDFTLQIKNLLENK